MSTHVAPHQAMAAETAPSTTGTRTAWLTSGQLTLRGVQLALLAGILLGSTDATSILVHDPRGQKMLFGAFVLTAGVLGANLLACMLLNRLVPPGDETRRARRYVLTWMLEGALVPMFYLPLVIVLLVGPPVIRVMEALTQP